MPNHREDNFFQKYVLPALIGLAATASAGAFAFAWNLNTKVALIESRQWVGREEFAIVKTELVEARKDLESMREWMRNHVQRSGGEAYPASAYDKAMRDNYQGQVFASPAAAAPASIPAPTPTPKPKRK